MIFDNCNVDSRARRTACDLAMVDPRDTHVVFFDTPVQECIQRVNGTTQCVVAIVMCALNFLSPFNVGRPWHPTIRAGSGQGVVRSKAKRFKSPSESEGFAAIHVIRTLEEASVLSQSWGGHEASISKAAVGDSEDLEYEPVDQVYAMQTNSVPTAAEDAANNGGLAAKNLEHYFGPVGPTELIFVRQRRSVLLSSRVCQVEDFFTCLYWLLTSLDNWSDTDCNDPYLPEPTDSENVKTSTAPPDTDS